MVRIFQPLLFMLARCTRNELIRHIEFLKAEDEILRSRLKKHHLQLKPAERARLLELGNAVGPALERIISIVRYQTFRRWLRDQRQQKPTRKCGRRPTPDYVQELVIRIAKETGWGYTRILGELKKLGVTKVSRQTVVNILKANGLEPGPRRGPGTWDEFLTIHAQTLWQCDFFSKRVLTRTGFKQAFVMAFINVATRRVIVSPSTLKLGDGWIAAQTNSFFEQVQVSGLEAKVVMRDNDSNYASGFDEAVRSHAAEVRPTAIRAPNENAYVERFVQTIKQECLDHFLAFGQKHFEYLVNEFVRYYHECRPHQGLDNKVVVAGAAETQTVTKADQVTCETRLGGMLKTYRRAA